MMLIGPQPSTQLLGNGGLGDIQSDLRNIFSILPGSTAATAQAKFNELIAFIRSQAEAGALQAVPQIEAKVKQVVTPYIIVALGMGGLGLALGVVAIMRTRK
jgi:hypothetical protein